MISTIGEFVGDGNGNIISGTVDVNDGSFAPTGAVALPPGTFQLDTNGNGTNFGRGMMTVNSKTYAFYIVDHTRIKFLEEDASGGSEGEALLQSGAIPTQNSDLKGSFVYLSGGSVTSGNFGPISRLGRMSANGAGVVSAVSFDENDDGNNTHISESSNLSAATYSMDANYPGSGRGTFTFHNSSVGTISYVFYFYSPTQAVIQDVSSGVVSGGSMLAQTGAPFTTSSTAGNYIFSWTGIQLVTPAPFAEDFVGQGVQTSTSSNNLSGLADYVELGLNSTNTGVTLNSSNLRHAHHERRRHPGQHLQDRSRRLQRLHRKFQSLLREQLHHPRPLLRLRPNHLRPNDPTNPVGSAGKRGRHSCRPAKNKPTPTL